MGIPLLPKDIEEIIAKKASFYLENSKLAFFLGVEYFICVLNQISRYSKSKFIATDSFTAPKTQ